MLQRQLTQLNFMRDLIRTFIHVMHNGYNLKLKIFSFIIQRQGIQLIFMTDTIITFRANYAKVRIFSLILQKQRIQSSFMTDVVRTLDQAQWIKLKIKNILIYAAKTTQAN